MNNRPSARCLVLSLALVVGACSSARGEEESQSAEDPNDTSWLTDDGSADNANAMQIDKGAVELGEPPAGKHYTADIAVREKHIYRFTAKAGGVVRLEMRAEGSPVNASLALLLPDGTKVARAAWQNADGKDAVADGYVLPQGGDVRIIATTYRLQSAGAYSLRLTCLQGPCGSSGPAYWNPTLKPMTLQKAKDLTLAASKVKYAKEYDPSTQWGVPWAWIQENCNRRASMVNFALSQGAEPTALPNPIPAQTLTQTLQSPKFESAQILLTGPLHVREQFVLPDGTPAGTTLAAWDHHVAAVVNVEGALAVIDLSLQREPLPVDDWVRSYMPSGLACPQLSTEEYQDISSYYLMRAQFDVPKPERPCGYIFVKPYGVRQDEALTSTAVRDELDGARSLLASNLEALVAELNGQVTTSTAPGVTALVEPLTDAELCAEMSYAFKWCKEYQP